MSEATKTVTDQESRNYPAVDRVLKEDSSALFTRMEKTCRRLEEFGRSGTPQEQSRAKAAITAYGRAMDLIRLLADTRDRMMAEQQQR